MADWGTLKPLKIHSRIMVVVSIILIAILTFTPRYAFRTQTASSVWDTTPEDLKTIDEKWKIDNSDIKTVWDVKKNTSEKPLSTTYYDKNIFPTDDSCISDKIENKKYKIVSLFRNNILGYDKAKKKYFPIWIESCSNGCGKGISFISDNFLKIVYNEADEETITVNLTNMTYKITFK